jgi:phosphatidylglycerol:prolipoprotein diacylglycerol transferase
MTSAALALVPYFRLEALELFGPLKIQPFGAMVAIAFVIGAWINRRIARERGLDPLTYDNAVLWLVLGTIVFGHVGDFFYHPEDYFAKPVKFLRVWEGQSSFGGFFGCAAVMVWYIRKNELNLLRFADVLLVGVIGGYAFGRLGCFVVHDHIGLPLEQVPAFVSATVGWLAVDFPATDPGIISLGVGPGPRFDLGLLNSVNALVVFGIVYALSRKPRRPGLLLGLVPMFYGSMRFWEDFMRTVDRRYSILGLELTPAQMGSVIIIFLGAWAIYSGRKLEAWPEPGTKPFEPVPDSEGATL